MLLLLLLLSQINKKKKRKKKKKESNVYITRVCSVIKQEKRGIPKYRYRNIINNNSRTDLVVKLGIQRKRIIGLIREYKQSIYTPSQ